MSEPGIASRIYDILSKSDSAATITYLNRRGQAAKPLAAQSLLEMAMARAYVIEETVPVGSTVLIVMPFGPDFLLSLLGCFFAGVTASPLPDPGSSTSFQRLDGIVLANPPAAILCTAANMSLIARHFEAQGLNLPLLVMDGPSMESSREPRCAGLRQPPGETVIVQYTSGSTRVPRGVALSGQNILSNAALVSERWRLSADKDLLVNWLPHYHDMGLMGGLLYPLLMGGPSIQMSPLAFVQHPANWLRTISKYRGTVSGGPAFAFGLCLDAVTDEDLEDLDLSCWQTAFCGAEPVPSVLLKEFRSRFARCGLDPKAVYASYGLAEATLLVAGEREWPGETASVENDGATLEACRLAPETRKHIRIVDPDTCISVADGVAGEVWVTGPSVACGYLTHDDDQSRENDTFSGVLKDGPQRFLRTGDLGWIGAAGLHISGRMKDVLIANGNSISAVDVEWLAAEFDPALNPLAAAAVSVTRDGPDDVALLIEMKTDFVTLQDRQSVEDHIRRAVRGAYGIELHTIGFVRRGSLERTTSGKVRRQSVADRLRAGYQYPEALA